MTRDYPTTKALGIFLLGLIFGIGGETMLFMRNQCRQIETALLEDFRVLAFLPTDVADSKGKVLEEKLRAMAGVAEARYVSRDGALKALEAQDPELARSVSSLGENPLNPFVDLRPVPESVGGLPGWLEPIARMPEIAQIKYKSVEWSALVRAQLYRRFLDVVASIAVLCWCLAAAMSLWALLTHGEHTQLTEFLHERMIWGFSGVLAGLGLVYVCGRPFQAIGSAWPWPSLGVQALLAVVGTLGATLFPEWHDPSAKRLPRHAQPHEHKVPIALLFFIAASVVGTSASAQRASVKRKELRDVQKQLEQKKREIEEYQRQAEDLQDDVSKLKGQTADSRRKMRALEERIREAEARKTDIKRRLWALETTEGQWRQVLNREINEHIRMQAGESDMIGRKAAWQESFRRAAILEKMHYVRQLKGTRDKTQALAADVAKKGKELEAKSQQAKAEHETKESLLQKKREVYQEAKEKVTDLQVLIKDLQDSAQALSRLVRSLEKKTPYKAKGGAIPLAESPHSLPWPVEGRVVSAFGKHLVPELDTWIINQGIRLATKDDAPIKPVKKGKVIFAGPFRSYGQVLIVDHGGDFYSIYGNLGQMSRKKGDSVRPSEQIGTAGKGKDGGQLYFEIRQSGEALDPVAWLKR
ncbi:MAG: peptidoglycan DD-metalloendopeptidase family protein [Proteobacteria bacterium]|nr:peptidoglycan DD-metalloendopeptidase family protein [Pseudomonadota bacterium]